MSTEGRIWEAANGDYIGATGVDSVREMAELALADGNEHIIDAFGLDGDATVDAVESHLNWLGVRADRVPAAHLAQERWGDSLVIPCGVDAKPGRGYVKVLGVSL